jgi:hypothetical protein
MIRGTRLAAAFALCAGLAVAGAAPAQTQSGTTPAADPAQPAPPTDQSTTVSPSDSDAAQHVYSVPPPDSSPDRDLPSVVGGYARSVAGCAVLGCEDAPQLGDPPGPLAPKPDEAPTPPPVNAQPTDPR